jgi:diguanylate cyclase (GGDEF)-like protein
VSKAMVGPSNLASDAALGAVLRVVGDAIFIFDEKLVCRDAGPGVRHLFSIDPASVIGQTRAALLDRLASGRSELGTLVSKLNDPEVMASRFDSGPIDLASPARRLVWTSAPILHDGMTVGRVDLVRDLTRERDLERQITEMGRKLEEATLVDALTGLGNLRRFEEECEREHRRAQRVWDSYAVVRVDVDDMAAVNAKYGRAKGDSLLRLLGERLRASRRQYDIVARWNNDDFALLLPCIDRTAVKRVLERAASQATEAAREAGFDIKLNMGVAVWTPPSADSATDVLGRATAALEAAREPNAESLHVDLDGTSFKNDPFASIGEPPERVD